MFYTYILESTASKKLYIGQTNNLLDRLRRHNANLVKSTKNRGPWVFLFHVSFQSRSEAVLLEGKLKRYKNPKKVREWIIGQTK